MSFAGYHQNVILKIRQLGPEFYDLTDAELSDLYSYWSEKHYSSRWLTLSEAHLFKFKTWANTTPIQRIKNA
jgi:hypothetical protein